MVQLIIRGKNLEVTESLRTLVEDKLGKLDRYDDSLTDVEVELSYEKARSAQDRNHVDASLLAGRSLILRAQARGVDMRAALDNLAEIIQTQLVRHKEKLHDRGQVSAGKTAASIVAADLEAAVAEEAGTPVVETEEVGAKPLSVDEAIDEMELAKQDWLIFVNADSNAINVLRRQTPSRYILYVPAAA